jgi:hypothetical protein
LDLSHLPRDRREAQVQRYIAEELQLPFDLTRSPLIRARLLRLDTADHVLLMTMHHHITDGWSMSVLTQELSALYQAFSTNQPFTRADLQLQYDEALFESSTIKRLLSAFESLLSDIAAHPKAHLLSLQLFGSKYLQSSTDWAFERACSGANVPTLTCPLQRHLRIGQRLLRDLFDQEALCEECHCPNGRIIKRGSQR